MTVMSMFSNCRVFREDMPDKEVEEAAVDFTNMVCRRLKLLFISTSENACTLNCNQANSMFLFFQPGSMWRSLGRVSQKGDTVAPHAPHPVGLLSVSLFCLEIVLSIPLVIIIYRHLLPGAAGPCFSVTPWVLPNDTFCDMSLEATCICIPHPKMHLRFPLAFDYYLFISFLFFSLSCTPFFSCSRAGLAVFPDSFFFFSIKKLTFVSDC